MRIVWGGSRNAALNDYFAGWASRIIWNERRGFGECTTMGVMDDDDLIAVVVFHNWYPDAGVIEMSAGSTNRRWLNRKTLHAMFAYPFDEIGVQMIIWRVSEFHKPLHRMLTAVGCNHVTIPRLRGRDEGETVFTLTEEDWRNNKFQRKISHGQEFGSEAA